MAVYPFQGRVKIIFGYPRLQILGIESLKLRLMAYPLRPMALAMQAADQSL